MANSKGETSGKALLFKQGVLTWFLSCWNWSGPDIERRDADVDDIVACLLANPEARMAVLAHFWSPEECAAVEKRAAELWQAIGEPELRRKLSEAEARLPHLEEAAELLRLHGAIHTVDDAKHWAGELGAWNSRDQALSAPTAANCPRCEEQLPTACDGEGCPMGEAGPTAESGKDSGPSLGVPGAISDSGAEKPREAEPGLRLAPDSPGGDAGDSEPAPVAESPHNDQAHSDDTVPVVLAEAPERVTYDDARDALIDLVDVHKARSASILQRYIMQREREVASIREDRRIHRVRAMELDIERDSLRAKLSESERGLQLALAAGVRRIGELEEAIADVADGFEQQGKRGLASQLRQLLPPEATASVSADHLTCNNCHHPQREHFMGNGCTACGCTSAFPLLPTGVEPAKCPVHCNSCGGSGQVGLGPCLSCGGDAAPAVASNPTPPAAERFRVGQRVRGRDCPNCGPGCRFDEDGCCGTCGSDTTLSAPPDPADPAPPRPGGDRPVMMGELIGALRELVDIHGNHLARRLADRLELEA